MSDTITPALNILRRKQVQNRIGLSRSTLYNLLADGEFPSPIRLSPRAIGWLESDIEDWINSRIAVSRKGDAP